jgi:hypothetical protein
LFWTSFRLDAPSDEPGDIPRRARLRSNQRLGRRELAPKHFGTTLCRSGIVHKCSRIAWALPITRDMRQHCAQCLTEVLSSGRQAPSGELLCYSCYLALWGPSASDALREMVHRHSGLRARNGQVAAQRV